MRCRSYKVTKMNANDRRIEEDLLPFYALGALTEEELAEVEAYLLDHPEALDRLDDLNLGVQALAISAAPVTPDPAVKTKLMSRVATEGAPVTSNVTATVPQRAAPLPTAHPAPPAKKRRSWFSRTAPPAAWPTAALAFTVLLALGLGWATLSLRNQVQKQQTEVLAMQSEVDSLAAENEQLSTSVERQQAQIDNTLGAVDSLTAENDALRAELTARDQQLALYREPGTVTISIGAISEAAAGATATFVRQTNGKTIVMRADNLPMLDATQDYQLWFIADGVPLSAGVFDADDAGQATLTVSGGLPADLQAIGISVEPAGGSDQPTPDQILLLGEVTT